MFSGFAGRQWIDADAVLPNGTKLVRWRYTSDPAYQGRGVYVDKVRVKEGRALLCEDADLVPNGWELVRD